MSANAERAERLARALRAGIEGDLATVRELCTADVTVWTPRFSSSSIDDLLSELGRGDHAFSDLQLEVFPLDVGGDLACVEWTVTMTHTGTLQVDEVRHFEPTGLGVTAIGSTVAEFSDLRICALRQYWDEAMLLRQLGLGECFTTDP